MRVFIFRQLNPASFVLMVLIAASTPFCHTAQALTAEDYESLQTIWKLGYVVGIAHGRALYRTQDGNAGEAAMDTCIPKMSDVEIVGVVDAYLAANPALGTSPAADIVIAAVSHHCAAK